MSSTESATPDAPEAASRRGRAAAADVAVIFLLACVLFAPFLFGGRIFLAADTLRQFHPWRAGAAPGEVPHNTLITDPLNANYAGVYNSQLKQGGLSSWNPLMFTGTPATGVSSMTGPPGRHSPLKLILHRVFDVPTAFMLHLFACVLLMGLTMHRYLVATGAGRRGALFGALAFMGNGYLMVWLEFESVGATAALVPLMLLVLERFRGTRPIAASAAGALVLGGIALMGMLQYVLYTGILLGAYLLFLIGAELRAGRRGVALRLPLYFSLSVAGALLIAGIELLPARELIESSARIAREFTFGGFFDTLGRLPARWLLTLVFPEFFGTPPLGFSLIPGAGGEYVNYNELCIYLGVPTLFALVGAVAAARRSGRALFFLLVAAATLAMLAGTWIYYPFFLAYPGMDRMAPQRLIFLFVLASSVAAGHGVRFLGELGGRGRGRVVAVFVVLAGAVAAFALAADSRDLALWLNTELLGQPRPGRDAMLDRVVAMRGLGSHVVVVPLLLALAAAGLWALFLRGGRAGSAAFVMLLALLAGDLFSFGWRYNSFSRPEEIYPSTPGIEFLRRAPKPFRVVMKADAGFLFNSLAPFGIEEVGGYSSFYPSRAGRLLSYAEYGERGGRFRQFDRWVGFSNLGSPLLPLMNARYYLLPPGTREPNPRYRLVYGGEMSILEDTAALPRAWVVPGHLVRNGVEEVLRTLAAPGFDPRSTVVLEEEPSPDFLSDAARAPLQPGVRISRHEPDAVDLEAAMPSRGWLVLADAWYPGWEATVGGRPVPILVANANFRALPLRAGTHEVSFRFRPPAVRRGLLTTGAGLLLALGGLIWAAIAERNRRRAASYGNA